MTKVTAPYPDGWRPDERYEDEELHHRTQDLDFSMHSKIYPSTDGPSIIEIARANIGPRVIVPVTEVAPRECPSFCWKDCALYWNTTAPQGRGHDDIFDCIYREWFPHRAMEQDVHYGSFFCKFLSCAGSNWQLKDIISFHEALCTRIATQENKIGTPKLTRDTFRRGAPIHYELRPTFPIVFLVIDNGDWKTEGGVIVVCKGEETAVALGLEKAKAMGTINSGDSGISWLAFRRTFYEAMLDVIAQDQERCQRQGEDSFWYNQEFGEGVTYEFSTWREYIRTWGEQVRRST